MSSNEATSSNEYMKLTFIKSIEFLINLLGLKRKYCDKAMDTGKC